MAFLLINGGGLETRIQRSPFSAQLLRSRLAVPFEEARVGQQKRMYRQGYVSRAPPRAEPVGSYRSPDTSVGRGSSPPTHR